MKIRHSLPVLFISLLLVLSAAAQDPMSRQQLQEQPDEWDEASWSPPDQDSTGLPGDNFSLQGALALFKQANSPEDFEKLLNTEDNKVNNLDLNGDGNIDYLRVINKKQNQVQVFVIQALVSNQESQDIAVIELEKTGENTAIIQIAGDEDIYGETTLAEPVELADSLYSAEDNTFNYNTAPKAQGPAEEEHTSRIAPAGVIVNVWFWPCVRRVYAPSYVVWTSPWSWINPPVWWRPWRPMPVYAYRPACYHYRHGYMYAPVRRIPPAQIIYYPARTYSGTVYNRNRVIVTNYRTTRADRTRFSSGYNGGRYDNYNRNGYNGGRYNNNYNGYRDNGYGRNNYYGGRPNTRPGYYNGNKAPDRPGRTPAYNQGGNYPGFPSNGSQGGRPGGNYQNGYQNTPGSGSQGGRPGGNYQSGYQNTPGSGSQGTRPTGGNYQSGYQNTPGSGSQGTRPTGSNYQSGYPNTPGSGSQDTRPTGSNQSGPRGGSQSGGRTSTGTNTPQRAGSTSGNTRDNGGSRNGSSGNGRAGRTRGI